MKQIKVHTDPKTSDSFILLEDIEDMFDITKVKTYSLDIKTDKSLILKLYDKNKKQINDPPQLYSINQASKILKMSESALHELIGNGFLKTLKSSSEVFLIKSQILRFKKEREKTHKMMKRSNSFNNLDN